VIRNDSTLSYHLVHFGIGAVGLSGSIDWVFLFEARNEADHWEYWYVQDPRGRALAWYPGYSVYLNHNARVGRLHDGTLIGRCPTEQIGRHQTGAEWVDYLDPRPLRTGCFVSMRTAGYVLACGVREPFRTCQHGDPWLPSIESRQDARRQLQEHIRAAFWNEGPVI
jgi:hypothetical protein